MHFLWQILITLTFLLLHGINGNLAERAPGNTCQSQAIAVCQTSKLNNLTYCGGDGVRYQDLCSFLLAACDHHHIALVGIGTDCTPSKHHPSTPHPSAAPGDFSLYRNIIQNIDRRLSISRAKGISPEDAKRIFTKQDHARKNYIRNPHCWAYDVDLTSISPWNSELGSRKPRILVTRKHVIGLRHFSHQFNSTIRLVDHKNHVVERRVIDTRPISGSRGLFIDNLVLEELDREVPGSISPMRVISPDSFFPVPSTLHVPATTVDTEGKILTEDVYIDSPDTFGLLKPSITFIRHDYYEAMTRSDSGSPSLLIIAGRPVLWMFYDISNGDTAVMGLYHHINDMIHDSGYNLTSVDLTQFLNHAYHIIGK